MAERTHITRGLRFTLTAIYTIVFTLLLAGVTLLFRQTLSSNLDRQANEKLEQKWAVVKAYMRIQSDPGQGNYHPVWNYDWDDPDESSAVADAQSVLLITDSDNRLLYASPLYQGLGLDSRQQVSAALASSRGVMREKTDARGTPYLVRSSYLYDEERARRKFYVAVGMPLTDSRSLLNRFTLLILALIPLVILTGCGMGWVFAGRALSPVLEVAQAAQRISGSNLSLRIPLRGSGDELDRLIATFNEMIERISVSFNQVRQFSTDVSHELRTPITVVRGQLEVALFTATTVDQYRDAIVNSLSDIERLSQIVRALLLLSQAETGQVILQKQQLDLVAVADSIVDQFQIPAEGAGISLTFEALSANCAADFDRVQIERMLSNLLTNALKFTPAGGHIHVSVARKPGEAEIIVADTGEGISPEHLPHIFDRFYRVRGPGEQASPEKGLGLGLSFVAWIVRAHGGAINVQSQPGEGTSFCVTLPLVAETPVPQLEQPKAA